jgi:hypothetical protein
LSMISFTPARVNAVVIFLREWVIGVLDLEV